MPIFRPALDRAAGTVLVVFGRALLLDNRR
jgi:hypothetical protein